MGRLVKTSVRVSHGHENSHLCIAQAIETVTVFLAFFLGQVPLFGEIGSIKELVLSDVCVI